MSEEDAYAVESWGRRDRRRSVIEIVRARRAQDDGGRNVVISSSPSPRTRRGNGWKARGRAQDDYSDGRVRE
jgi:hypothetical protein